MLIRLGSYCTLVQSLIMLTFTLATELRQWESWRDAHLGRLFGIRQYSLGIGRKYPEYIIINLERLNAFPAVFLGS